MEKKLLTEDERDALVVNALFEAALSGNVTAIVFWLKNRRPDLWRDKPELVENSGDGVLPELLRAIREFGEPEKPRKTRKAEKAVSG